MKGKRVGQGVVGRRALWQGIEWTVTKVYGEFLELRREHKNRDWFVGNVVRTDVKFVRRDYTI